MWRKRIPCALLLGVRVGAVTVENSTEFPQKLKKIELPYDPAIILLEIYPKEMKTLTQKGICTPTFIAALFTIV